MKNYVKIVQAVQYLGDIKVLKDLISKKDVIQDENGVYLYMTPGKSEGGYWNLKETDYVTVENGSIFVYKKEKFEADFDEVEMEDILAAEDVKEIKVKEFVELKAEKKVPVKDSDLDKKK